MMKLISWNVNARVKDGAKQVKALGQQEPHVVAFQDIRATAVAQYEQAFAEMGLCHVLHTFQEISDEPAPTGVLIASCFELERLPLLPSSALWPEGVQSPDPEKMMKHWASTTVVTERVWRNGVGSGSDERWPGDSAERKTRRAERERRRGE